MAKGKAILKICYIVNIVLMVLFFITAAAGSLSWDTFLLVHFLGYATIGWPIFVVFQGLNAWMWAVYKDRRRTFLVISIVLGIYNAFFLYVAIDWWLSGAPMP